MKISSVSGMEETILVILALCGMAVAHGQSTEGQGMVSSVRAGSTHALRMLSAPQLMIASAYHTASRKHPYQSRAPIDSALIYGLLGRLRVHDAGASGAATAVRCQRQRFTSKCARSHSNGQTFRRQLIRGRA